MENNNLHEESYLNKLEKIKKEIVQTIEAKKVCMKQLQQNINTKKKNLEECNELINLYNKNTTSPVTRKANETNEGYDKDFEIKYITNQELENNFTIKETYYINNTNENYKIVIPDGIKEEIKYVFYLEYKSQLQFSIKKFYTEINRTFVNIYCNDLSNGNIISLNYYTSISDGSFWRYCLKYVGMYAKGYNYVSSTFINIYLQRFIFEHMNLFNISIDNKIDCPYLYNEDKNDNDKYLLDRVEEDTYVSKCKFFNIINKVFPHVKYLQNYKSCLLSLEKLITSLTVTETNDNIKISLDICSNIFESLFKYKLCEDDFSSSENKKSFFTRIKYVFSEIFLKYFELIESTKKKIFDRKFAVIKLNYNSSIYSIEIKLKSNPEEIYILYYMIYYDENINDKKYKTIIYIIPKIFDDKDNSLTQYGLDTSYVVCGAMINKIYDYDNQIGLIYDELRKDSDMYNIFGLSYNTEGYSFIGFLTDYDFLSE